MRVLLLVSVIAVGGCAQSPAIIHRTVVPAFLTDMPSEPTINPVTATSKDVALYLIDLHADDKMCRARLRGINKHYGDSNE